MRRFVATILLGSLAATAREASADGLLYQLPEDGAWVRFETTLQRGPEDEKGAIVMRSVGRTKEDEPCRWIEMVATEANSSERIVVKLLITENHLKAGETPLEHVIRGWRKEGDKEVEKVVNAAFRGPLPVLLPGPLQNTKKLEKKETIEWQHGKLECEIVTGDLRVTTTDFAAPGSATYQVTYRVWRNEKVPFGAAAVQLHIAKQREDNGEFISVGSLKLEAREAGKNAKTELPGVN